MKNYTEEEKRILFAIRQAYDLGYKEGTINGAGHAHGHFHYMTEDELDNTAEEIFNYLFNDDDDEELYIPDDVDESNYDPYIGGDFFEADYNLGEAEEW